MAIAEGKELQTKGIEYILNKRIAQKLPKSQERDTHPGTGGF
jgi:hypothetical protein